VVLTLADVPTHGSSVSLGAWARSAAAEGIGGEVRAFEGDFTITRHAEHLAVRGEIHLVGEVPCDRCRAPLLLSLGGEISVLYSPISAVPETEEDQAGLPRPPIQLDEPVEDFGEYDGVGLDLAEVVREWATVERPVRFLCAELDEAEDEPCRARFRAQAQLSHTPNVDARFAVLSSLSLSEE
jgi:uncharacterized metal-binding protein YceD (DUF177 family)